MGRRIGIGSTARSGAPVRNSAFPLPKQDAPTPHSLGPDPTAPLGDTEGKAFAEPESRERCGDDTPILFRWSEFAFSVRNS
jgi:hypothetical protein